MDLSVECVLDYVNDAYAFLFTNVTNNNEIISLPYSQIYVSRKFIKVVDLDSALILIQTIISLSNPNVANTKSNISNCNDNTKDGGLIASTSPSHTITSLIPSSVHISQLSEDGNNNNKRHSGGNGENYEFDGMGIPTSTESMMVQNVNNTNNNMLYTTSPDQTMTIYLLEKVVEIIKLCSQLTQVSDPKTHQSIKLFLNQFVLMKSYHLFMVSRRVVYGIKSLLSVEEAAKNNEIEIEMKSSTQQQQTQQMNNQYRVSYRCIKSKEDWCIVLKLLRSFDKMSSTDQQCCLEAFEVIEIISESHLYLISIEYVFDGLLSCASYERDAPIYLTRVIKVLLSIYGKLNQIISFDPGIGNSDENERSLGRLWRCLIQKLRSFESNGVIAAWVSSTSFRGHWIFAYCNDIDGYANEDCLYNYIWHMKHGLLIVQFIILQIVMAMMTLRLKLNYHTLFLLVPIIYKVIKFVYFHVMMKVVQVVMLRIKNPVMIVEIHNRTLFYLDFEYGI